MELYVHPVDKDIILALQQAEIKTDNMVKPGKFYFAHDKRVIVFQFPVMDRPKRRTWVNLIMGLCEQWSGLGLQSDIEINVPPNFYDALVDSLGGKAYGRHTIEIYSINGKVIISAKEGRF